MLPYFSWSSRPPGSAAAADPASLGALYRLPSASSCFTRFFAPTPSTTTTTWTTTDVGTRVRSPTTAYTPAGTCPGAAAPNPAAGTRTPADTRSAAAAAVRTAASTRSRDVAAAAAARMNWRRLSAPARNDHHESWRLWMGGHDPATPFAEALINTHNHNVMWMTFIIMTVFWALKCRM